MAGSCSDGAYRVGSLHDGKTLDTEEPDVFRMSLAASSICRALRDWKAAGNGNEPGGAQDAR
jgi:hypothetical protein